MNKAVRHILFWAPRLLTILFAVFLSMFAMDVFAETKGLWETIGDLLLHLVPVFIILIVLIIAWRWEWVGAVLFIGTALLYIVMMWGKPLSWHVSIAGPAALIGILFLLNWLFREAVRGS